MCIGNTPLHQLFSIYSKNEIDSYKILKILVTNGANPNAINNQDLTPLLLAIKKRQKGAVRDILKMNKTLKSSKLDEFNLNFVEKSSQFNALYLLLKYKLCDLAETVFCEGGNA